MVGKMRWGDSAELDDDGDFDMSAALPASQVSAAPDHEPPRTSSSQLAVERRKP